MKTASIVPQSMVDVHLFKHLKIEKIKNSFRATLVDEQGFAILRGFGQTIAESINDLHFSLL